MKCCFAFSLISQSSLDPLVSSRGETSCLCYCHSIIPSPLCMKADELARLQMFFLLIPLHMIGVYRLQTLNY